MKKEAIDDKSAKITLNTFTFGNDKRTKADLEVVRVCLMVDGHEIIIDALVSPVLSLHISAHL